MTSPRRTCDGMTGSTKTSDPLWMAGSIEAPVTTKGLRPVSRRYTKATQRAKSTATRRAERTVPIWLRIFFIVRAPFFCIWETAGAVRSAGPPRPEGDLLGRPSQLGRGVGDREVLRQVLVRVARVRDDHGTLGRVTRDEVGHVDEVVRVRLVVAHGQGRGRECVAGVRACRGERRGGLLGRCGEADQDQARQGHRCEELLAHLVPFLDPPRRRSVRAVLSLRNIGARRVRAIGTRGESGRPLVLRLAGPPDGGFPARGGLRTRAFGWR